MPLVMLPIPLLFFHLAGIAGVVLASDRSLKKYIAIKSLPVPSFVQEDASKPAQPPKVLTRWDRFKKNLIFFGSVLALVAIVVAFSFALVLYGGRMSQDITYCLLSGVSNLLHLVSMLRIVHNATPETIRFERKTADGSISRIHHREDPTSLFNLSRPITLKIVSLVLCASVFAFAYLGEYHPFGLFVGSLVFLNVAMMSETNSNIRRVMKTCSLMLVGWVACFLIVLTSFNMGKVGGSTEESTPSEKKTDVKEICSPWVMPIVFIWNYVLPVQFPGLIVALALRYDYARSEPNVPTLSQDRAVVPARLPPFRKPIFKWSLFSLFAAIFACHAVLGLTNLFPNQSLAVPMTYITVPVVAVSTNLAVWLHGDFRSWWVYSESWMPSKEVLAEVDAIREVEKAVEPEEKVDLIDLNEKSDVQ